MESHHFNYYMEMVTYNNPGQFGDHQNFRGYGCFAQVCSSVLIACISSWFR